MRQQQRNLFLNKEATNRENELMLKRLERQQKRTSESDKNQALAKLAGIDILPNASGAGKYRILRWKIQFGRLFLINYF